MSGAVDNAPQLKKIVNLDLIICSIVNMPKKERCKSTEKGKWPLLSRLCAGLAQGSSWSISAGLKMAGLKLINVI